MQWLTEIIIQINSECHRKYGERNDVFFFVLTTQLYENYTLREVN